MLVTPYNLKDYSPNEVVTYSNIPRDPKGSTFLSVLRKPDGMFQWLGCCQKVYTEEKLGVAVLVHCRDIIKRALVGITQNLGSLVVDKIPENDEHVRLFRQTTEAVIPLVEYIFNNAQTQEATTEVRESVDPLYYNLANLYGTSTILYKCLWGKDVGTGITHPEFLSVFGDVIKGAQVTVLAGIQEILVVLKEKNKDWLEYYKQSLKYAVTARIYNNGLSSKIEWQNSDRAEIDPAFVAKSVACSLDELKREALGLTVAKDGVTQGKDGTTFVHLYDKKDKTKERGIMKISSRDGQRPGVVVEGTVDGKPFVEELDEVVSKFKFAYNTISNEFSRHPRRHPLLDLTALLIQQQMGDPIDLFGTPMGIFAKTSYKSLQTNWEVDHLQGPQLNRFKADMAKPEWIRMDLMRRLLGLGNEAVATTNEDKFVLWRAQIENDKMSLSDFVSGEVMKQMSLCAKYKIPYGSQYSSTLDIALRALDAKKKKDAWTSEENAAYQKVKKEFDGVQAKLTAVLNQDDKIIKALRDLLSALGYPKVELFWAEGQAREYINNVRTLLKDVNGLMNSYPTS